MKATFKTLVQEGQDYATKTAGLPSGFTQEAADFAKASVDVNSHAATAGGMAVSTATEFGGMTKKLKGYDFQSFDNNNNGRMAALTFAYNAEQVTNQGFIGKVFPMVLRTIDTAGAEIEGKISYLYNNAKRRALGAGSGAAELGMTPISDIVRSASALTSGNKLRLIPILATDPTAYIGDLSHIVDGVETAPFKIDDKFSLLTHSQTAADLSAGVLDVTDEISQDVRLDTVAFKVGDATDNRFFSLEVGNVEGSEFAPLNGNAGTLTLSYIGTETVTIGETVTRGTTGSDPLATLTTGNKIELQVNVSAQLDAIHGDIVVTANQNITVVSVVSSTGIVYAPTDVEFVDAVTVFGTASVVGTEIKAGRTNRNHRIMGQLLTSRGRNLPVSPEVLAPIDNIIPTNASTADIETGIEEVSNFSKLVIKATGYLNLVAEAAAIKREFNAQTKSVNIGTNFAKTYYKERTHNVTDLLNLRSSEKRDEALAAAVLSMIKTAIVEMNGDAAISALNGGKASFVVGVGTHIASLIGEKTLVVGGHTVHIETEDLIEMNDEIWILPYAEQTSDTEYTPGNAGVCIWVPVPVGVRNTSRGNADYKVVTAQPVMKNLIIMRAISKINLEGFSDSYLKV